MDNVDDIIKQRLQWRIAEVLKEYRNGNIRREVEEELENKRKDEKLQQRLKTATESHETSSNLLEFRFFWQALFFNKRYYNALYQIYGKGAYKNKREQAIDIWIFIAFILIIATSYYMGWQNIDDVETYHQNLLKNNYTDTTISVPYEGGVVLFLLAFFPFCSSFALFIFVGCKLTGFISILAFCWAVYVPIMLANRFEFFEWGICSYFVFVMSFLMTLILAILVGTILTTTEKDAP